MEDEKIRAVILAGGKGSRMGQEYADIPKPMIRLAGKPVLQYQIECLYRQGIRDVILAVGHKREAIQSYWKNRKNLPEEDINIRFLSEEMPLGTGGVLFFLKDIVKDDFLLLNGDVLFDVDIERFRQVHLEKCRKGALATILVHPNQHPYDSAIVVINSDGCVTEWLNKEEQREWYRNCVNAGLHFLSPEIFPYLESKGLLLKEEKLDLDRNIWKLLMKERKLYVYESPEYVKDMGTPERCRQVEKDIRQNKLEEKNLKRKQKAIFLDRDGTINEHVGFLKRADEFRLLPGTAEAIRLMNEKNYLVIVVTNQPVVARGETTVEELERIHRKMETLLGKEGAYVDAVYFCPHHPDKGYPGEVSEFKTECSCRKPKAGMLLNAAQKYNIDLRKSWMAGDSIIDIQAGKAAGCYTAGIYGCQGENGTFATLLDFAEFLCGECERKD